MKGNKVTIYDIAKASGCSPATVSLVMKNDNRVAKKTKEKVLRIADELEYRPSYFGRSLITGKSNTIKVVIPDIHNPVFSNIVDGVEQYINQTEYHVLLDVTYNSKERELDSFASLLDKKVDGIIISPIYEKAVTDYIFEKGIDPQKIIYVGIPCDGSEQVHYCAANSKKGAYLGVKNMLLHGCRRVAFLAPTVIKRQGLRRKEGYFEALREFGIERDEKLIVGCSQDFSEIYEKTYKLLKEQKPDGIFCLYDYAAIPVMKAAVDRGLNIPKDLMITGYDNIDIGEYLDRPLTTVDPHQKEQGYRAAEILMAMLDEKECPVKNMIEPTLVVRETTRKAI